MAHETISRQHAALQFDESGELYVVDLGSSHGTKLNRQPLRPKQFQSVPVGGSLQFGASTRFYVLQGPDELLPPEEESDELARKRAAADRTKRELAAKGASALKASAAAASAARAMGSEQDEAALKADQDLEADIDSIPLTAGNIHANDQALFSKLQSARHKLKSASNEAETLKGKQAAANSSHHAGQFTEGQQRALASMDARLSALHDAVEEAEAGIRQRMHARRRAAAGGRGGSGVTGGGDFSSRAGTRALNEGSRVERQFLQSEEADFDDNGAPSGRATMVVRHAWAHKGTGKLGKKSTASSFIKKRAGVSRGGSSAEAAAPTAELVGLTLSALETATSLKHKLSDLAAQAYKQHSQLASANSRARRAAALLERLSAAGQGESVDGVVAASEVEAAQGAACAIQKHLSGLEASQVHLGKLLALTGDEGGVPAAGGQSSTPAQPAAAAPVNTHVVDAVDTAPSSHSVSTPASGSGSGSASGRGPPRLAADLVPATGRDMVLPSLPLQQVQAVPPCSEVHSSAADAAAPMLAAAAAGTGVRIDAVPAPVGGTKRARALDEVPTDSAHAVPAAAPEHCSTGAGTDQPAAQSAPATPVSADAAAAAVRAKRARLSRRDVQQHYEGDGEDA